MGDGWKIRIRVYYRDIGVEILPSSRRYLLHMYREVNEEVKRLKITEIIP